MPTPKKGESKQEFINRYMSSGEATATHDNDKNKQLAAANSIWERYKDNFIKKSIYQKDEALREFSQNHTGTPCEESVNFDAPMKVTKAVDDDQLVFGWANVSIKADGSLPFDWQGDIKSPQTLEKAAYNFVLKYRIANEQHEQNDEVRGNLVESVMFTKEKLQAMGIPEETVPEGWWVGFHIPDKEVFAKVKNGTYKMFSIEGTAKRIPIENLA